MLFIVFLILGLVSFFVFENFLYVKFFFFLIKDSKLVLFMFFCLIVVILGGDEFLVLVFGLSFFEMFFNFFDIFLRIITDIFDKFCFYLENLFFFFSFGLVCGLGGVRFFVVRSSILFFLSLGGEGWLGGGVLYGEGLVVVLFEVEGCGMFVL